MPLMRPTVNAVVSRQMDDTSYRSGVVVDVPRENTEQVKVRWADAREGSWVPLDELTCGFKPGMEVHHEPQSSVAASYGWGIVRTTRTIAGISRVLVEFLESNRRIWLPWQCLKMVYGVYHRFHTKRFETGKSAEKQRLRLLAWAIKLWNENTGALATFDVDPLPHQIHLVHHILASGDYNWLIADDVGLGKTIEVGLLLSALRQRGEANRILLLTPAGLTRQWQEEMASKFGMDQFRIYGDDFHIREPQHWKMYDQVIASMDRLKQEEHLESILQAEPWDLVIIDEAHRMTRRQYGLKYDSSQRYDLAKTLRQRTDSMLLLTATPHQGREDSFVGLLELLHPDRREELLTLASNPEIIGDMVFRNYKADVTDLEGNFIFHGKTVRQVEVPVSGKLRDFDQNLQKYIRKGYDASSRAQGNTGHAIGFVMTVYRKLAASSIAAIHQALVRRKQRLLQEEVFAAANDADERFQGEFEEFHAPEETGRQFFEGEIELLDELIAEAETIKKTDEKVRAFMDNLVNQILSHHPTEKILVFTEYRSTQNWIKQALTGRFGENCTVQIHGGMSMQERRHAIDSFDQEHGAQFLVSTEAGGEGINLQERCHIMVNYDLPWNPMRLVQRIGRLYRYGQQQRVVVFNIHQAETADEKILDILYQRLDQVAQDMATVQEKEFNEAMKEDILGELADLVDVEDILASANQTDIERTSERIDEALQLAQSAASKQQDLFQHASGFDPSETQSELNIGTDHLASFVEGMAEQLEIEIAERTHNEKVWHLRLPESVSYRLGTRRMRRPVTFDRMIAAQRPDIEHMNMDSLLLQFLLNCATQYEFGGITSLASGLKGDALIACVARWQNERGGRSRQELAVVEADEQASKINPEWVTHWLTEPQAEATGYAPNAEHAKTLFGNANQRVERLLRERSSLTMLPDEPQWVAAACKRNDPT